MFENNWVKSLLGDIINFSFDSNFAVPLVLLNRFLSDCFSQLFSKLKSFIYLAENLPQNICILLS
jgi:hypothetical protein